MYPFQLSFVLGILAFLIFLISDERVGQGKSPAFERLLTVLREETNQVFSWYKANGALGAVSKLSFEQRITPCASIGGRGSPVLAI